MWHAFPAASLTASLRLVWFGFMRHISSCVLLLLLLFLPLLTSSRSSKRDGGISGLVYPYPVSFPRPFFLNLVCLSLGCLSVPSSHPSRYPLHPINAFHAAISHLSRVGCLLPTPTSFAFVLHSLGLFRNLDMALGLEPSSLSMDWACFLWYSRKAGGVPAHVDIELA